MSDKIIIEEVLWEKLEEKGIKQPYDTEHEEQLAKVLIVASAAARVQVARVDRRDV